MSHSPEKLAYMREYMRRHKRDPSHVLRERYNHMLARAEGRAVKHTHAKGKPILPREEFMAWAKLDIAFVSRWIVWRNRGFPRPLTPSIDRIDVTRGYELDNIQWLTWQENLAKRHQDNLRRSEAEYE